MCVGYHGGYISEGADREKPLVQPECQLSTAKKKSVQLRIRLSIYQKCGCT